MIPLTLLRLPAAPFLFSPKILFNTCTVDLQPLVRIERRYISTLRGLSRPHAPLKRKATTKAADLYITSAEAQHEHARHMSTSSSRRRETFFDRRRRAAREAREAEEAEPQEMSGSFSSPPTPDTVCPPEPRASPPNGATRVDSSPPSNPNNTNSPPPVQQQQRAAAGAATSAPPITTTSGAAAAAAAALRTSHAYLTGGGDGERETEPAESGRRGFGGGGGGGGERRAGRDSPPAEEEEAASCVVARLDTLRALLLEMEYNMRWDAQQPTWTQCRDHWRRRVGALTPGAETCALLSKSLLGACLFFWFFCSPPSSSFHPPTPTSLFPFKPKRSARLCRRKHDTHAASHERSSREPSPFTTHVTRTYPCLALTWLFFLSPFLFLAKKQKQTSRRPSRSRHRTATGSTSTAACG